MSTLVDLNGAWDLAWDPEDHGIEHRWFASFPSTERTVEVPHLWERDAQKPEATVAFYFKKFATPPDEQKRVFLRFERVSAHATVWFNAKLVGEHFGAWSAFEVDVSKYYKPGETNYLCVRVASSDGNKKIQMGDIAGDGADHGVSQDELPVGLPWAQYPFGGIYGKVQMLLGEKAFISKLVISPDQDQERAILEMQFNNPRKYQARLKIFIRNPSGGVAEYDREASIDRENGSLRLALGFKDIRLWSPEHPNLYTVEVQLEKSLPVVSHFGFRKFDVVKGDYWLNDQVLKLRGVVYSQHSSEGGPWTQYKDLKTIKDLGFNCIRSGGAPLPAAALDICDELGLLVFQDFPIDTESISADGLEKVRAILEEVVLEGQNHPSLGIWVLGAENGTLILANSMKLLDAMEKLDNTHAAMGNINNIFLSDEQGFKKDISRVLGVTDSAQRNYDSHRLHLRMNPNAALTYFLTHYGSKDYLELAPPDVFLGNSDFQDEYEQFVADTRGKFLVTLKNHILPYGAKAPKLPGVRTAKNAKALQALYKQVAQFLEAEGKGIWKSSVEFFASLKAIGESSREATVEALQANHVVSGFFLDQWADCGADMNGIVTESRASKGSEASIHKLTQNTRLLLTGFERTALPGDPVEFQLALLNEARLKSVVAVMEIKDAAGKVLASQQKTVESDISLTQMGEFTLPAPKKAGDYVFELTLLAGKPLYTHTEPLIVLSPAKLRESLAKVCILADAESSADALAMLRGKEKIVLMPSFNSWSEAIGNEIAEEVKKGKTLVLTDISAEDIEAFNSCPAFAVEPFNGQLECHFSTGASGASLHYIPQDSPLSGAFCGRTVLDSVCCAVMPGVSLAPIEGAKIYARSVTLSDGELKTGVDLQVVPFGKGKLVFNQFSIIEGLETNALTDQVFEKLIEAVK
jgi:hypothetical protein